MEKKLNILTLAYFAFLILLFLSGMFSGVLSEVIYYLSFILPVAVCLYLTRGDGVGWKKHLTIDKEGVTLSWPLVFPTISLIMLISYITSFIIFTLTGKTSSVDIGDSYLIALITHALIPAIFEEALFRYLPMRLIGPHSPRCAIIVSALFFALVHGDLFSIPYAFIAGLVFMAIDLATDSIIPSVIIHFINNALSVSLMFIPIPGIIYVIYIWLGLLTFASVITIKRSFEEYEIPLMLITEKGEGVRITPNMIFFALITLSLAILNIL